jgi:integrase
MAGKRGNGEGTIKHRADGSWEARISLGDGRRKSLYGKTRQVVASKLAAVTRDRDKGVHIARDERQTVGQFLTDWLSTVKPTVKPSTWRRYRQYVQSHAMPALGKLALSRLSPQQLQALYAAKLEEGLSPTTVHHLHTVLHGAFDQALRWGLVSRNVLDLVDPPRMAHHEMHPLNTEEARTLLATAQGNRLEALYVLALHTGMRQGELLALKWHDIDLKGEKLQVCGSLQRAERGMIIDTPKTAHSRRKIALTSAAVEALRQHRARQLEERLALGEVWEEHDLVFPNTIGMPMDGINLLRREFLPLLVRAGLPRIRFHDLRHTAATLMLAQGVNVKVVSEMLGHADVAITLRIYAHVLPDMQASATAALDSLFGS